MRILQNVCASDRSLRNSIIKPQRHGTVWDFWILFLNKFHYPS